MLPLLHQQIEECGFNALPVMQSQLYDGWTIRLSGGGPRRANSINVMAPSTLPLSEKLAHSMPLFYQNGISPTFRLTGHEFNRELDSFLENEGYSSVDASLVMMSDLNQLLMVPETPLQLIGADDWFLNKHDLDQGEEKRKLKHIDLLRKLTLPTLFGALVVDARVVSIGLAVVDGIFAGIFDVATLSASRRCGYARSLVLGLLHQAKEAGADKVYLQVMADNAAAISLYKSIGFHQIYAYHYRVKFDVFEEGASDTSKLQSLFD